ncbi:hypothetical protein AB0M45_08610 [Nocardia sp. NPDC051787]
MNRTENSGLTTEVVYESVQTEARRQELPAIVDEWGGAGRTGASR